MKNVNWEKTKKELLKEADSLGCPIDKGIIDAVVGLNILGINTIASCEGHLDCGCPNPWIDIESEEDVSILLEEASSIQKKADSEILELSYEEKSKFWKKSNSLMDEAAKPNLRERVKLVGLLNEFYHDRLVLFDVQLHIEDYDFFCSRLESNGASLQDIRTKKEKAEKLELYSLEMSAFADFLKTKIV